MRKIVSLLLAIILLFSFSACNNTDNSSDIEIKYVGEWKANVVSSLFDGVKTYQTSTVNLLSDGSVTFKEHSFRWRFSDETNEITLISDETNQKASFEIDMIDGKEVIRFFDDIYYRVEDFVAKEKENVEQGSNEQTAENPSGNNITENKYSSAVHITLENWQEYFEVVECPVWKENTFGEVAEVTVFWVVNLKEKYHSSIDTDKSSIVSFEITAKCNSYGVQVDYSNKKYSYLDCLTTFEAETENESVKFDFSKQFNYDKTEIDYLKVYNSSVWDGEYADGKPTKAIYKYYDIKVPRVEGTIYLYDN